MTSALALAACAALAAGFSPLEADEPHVREGNARLEAGDAAAALGSYAEAERAVGSRAEIDHDRGNALAAAGRAAEAKASWRRAAERAPPPLSSRALQNLGTALAEEGDREGAARAFADALAKDPSNDDARWNLEVLLRGGARRPPPPAPAPSQPSQAGAEGAQERADAKDPAGEEPGDDRRDRPEREDGPRPTAPEQRPPDASAEAGEEEAAAPAEREGDGAPRRAPLSRQDAERLLDALRARERNMPFSPTERREARGGDDRKDW